jgi:hypothetical protein
VGGTGRPLLLWLHGYSSEASWAMVDNAKKPSRNLPQPACCNPLVDQAATTGLDFSENMSVEPVRWAHASARWLGREGVLLTAADTDARDDSVTIQRLWPARAAARGHPEAPDQTARRQDRHVLGRRPRVGPRGRVRAGVLGTVRRRRSS